MNTALIVGVAALLLMLFIGFLFVRSRKSSAAQSPADVAAEPQRRRSVGPAPIATAPELEPAPALATAPAPALLDDVALEPRRRIAIGLSPIDAPSIAAPDADEEDEAVDEELTQEPPFAEPAEVISQQRDAVAAFPAPRQAESPIVTAAPNVEPPVLDEAPAPPLALAPADGDEPPSILSQLKTKKKSAPGALAGASEGSVSAPMGPSEVEEIISLVLARQIPPRFDEAPRSWLGGLPMMPDDVEWPRSVAPERLDEGEVPLHFIAQIACADYPEDLWGGVGPRSGWLLLFLNPHDSQGDDPRLFRVIHTADLGTERQPPEDLRPVESDDIGESEYRHFATPDAIPSTWRRWPVDLVTVPNEAHDNGYRMIVTPKDFATKLYDGAPNASGTPDVAGAEPFSWRGALYVVDAVLRELGQPASASQVAPAQRDALDNPGYVASIVPELRGREQVWLSEGEGAILSKEEPLRERERELRDRIAPIAEDRRAQLDRLAAFIVEHPTGAAIAKRIASDARTENEWRAAAAERLATIRAQIADRSLDTALDTADWAALRGVLEGDRHSRWTVEWTSRNSDFPVMIVEQRTSLLDLAGAGLKAAVVELAADYQGDPDLQHLVPPAVREALEPHWRNLTDNRPHRIGGFHDGLQSEPEDGPQAEVLLFQIASDEAMHWMWGDGGAYFFFISPRNLAAGRFDLAEIRLEQP